MKPRRPVPMVPWRESETLMVLLISKPPSSQEDMLFYRWENAVARPGPPFVIQDVTRPLCEVGTIPVAMVGVRDLATLGMPGVTILPTERVQTNWAGTNGFAWQRHGHEAVQAWIDGTNITPFDLALELHQADNARRQRIVERYCQQQLVDILPKPPEGNNQ